MNDLQLEAKAVYPSLQNIQSQYYQPLTRKQYLYIRKSALNRPEVAAFLLFYLEQLPALQPVLQFVPLLPSESMGAQNNLLNLLKQHEARKAN
jgi:phosphate transport system substrate-binding protein